MKSERAQRKSWRHIIIIITHKRARHTVRVHAGHQTATELASLAKQVGMTEVHHVVAIRGVRGGAISCCCAGKHTITFRGHLPAIDRHADCRTLIQGRLYIHIMSNTLRRSQPRGHTMRSESGCIIYFVEEIS